ncbi:MAG: hypothetical protein ACOC5G_04320 [Acidobacteriota bacterium]
MENMDWSKKEKQIARQAFNKAYKKEVTDILNKAKDRLPTLKSPEDIWELHDFLTEKREETDNKYDYRYSVLILVFSRLINEGWITMDDLKGLEEDKISKINQVLKLYR